ncbi:integrase domain-containing protein [Noviherbaspirillum sp. CPCC 100848]|uniref:Integrase domain-containing protein n=1 Tax=Noviherbaspirillum album TaxID=3080276 RepID=A0ABU6J3M0_9BURK|nr:integrase domain-containing protein [Noviherbaspirillum sp. CPCC 100848]MEC4718223.1 integrase domain-containing protein [Noviherbaspirillum sp. CPCC 100848]
MRDNTSEAMLPKPLVDALDRHLNHRGRRTVKDDRNVGDYTLVSRRSGLLCGFAELRHMGFKLTTPDSLRENHIKALVSYWVQQEFSASTIQNRLAHFRALSKWIGKPGMVRSTMSYVDEANRHRVRRTVAAQENLSWKGKGIDVTEVIKEAERRDKYTALYLRLMHAFGLRLREAICLRPLVDVADNGHFLSVRDGTKGGRHRIVQIETDYQRETLSLAAAMSQPKNKRIIAAHRSLEQAYQRTRYQMRKLGLTREGLGVTAHGLRHQYAQNRYEKIAGIPSPICGGDPAQIDRDTHLHACYDVMQQLGHSRVDVAASYYGTHGHALRGKDNPGMPWEREARKAKALQAAKAGESARVMPNYGEVINRATKVQYSFVLKAQPTALSAGAHEPGETEAS